MTIIKTPKLVYAPTAKAYQAFQIKLTAMGATLLEEEWLGSKRPHRVQCKEGHECFPKPNNVQQGQGVCRTCAGQDPKIAEHNFRNRLTTLGAILLETKYLGNHIPHKVQCKEGHIWNPTPGNIRDGHACRACARRDPAIAEQNFQNRLTELGATLLEEKWLGAKAPHKVQCREGHISHPHPNSVQQGQGICRTCAERDPKLAELRFRNRLDDLGAILLESKYLGNHIAHKVLCREGHICTPRPTAVLQGHGVCRICAGKIWDVFYVIQHDVNPWIKFGITSGDPQPRLAGHARQGYKIQIGLFTDLPSTVAPDLERELIHALDYEGYYKVQGREYYELEALPRIVEITNSMLGI